MGLLLRLVLLGAFLFAGWIAGSLYPAPAALTNLISERTSDLAERLDIEGLNWDALKERLSPEQFATLQRDAADLASKAGDAIIVERGGEMLEEHMDEPASDIAALRSAAAAGFEDSLSLCPRMTVSNAPAADANRQVTNYPKVVNVNGVSLAVNPTRGGACLSSGFGPRNGRTHKGLDYHKAEGAVIMAGAAGTVIEKKYRDDYGNMLLIDHGRGVYTRYAHLSSFANGIVVGAQVSAGQELGLMGNTASYPIPVHLHYEVLLGDYANPRASFGLTPHSPFEYPRAG